MAFEGNVNVNNLVQTIVQHLVFRETINAILLILINAIINYWTESHLESCQTSTVELLFENSQRPYQVDYFGKKAPPQIFEWIPNLVTSTE